MDSKYVDTTAIVQVIGNIFKNTSLLDDEKYHFNEEDFPQDFHKILFGTIYNLHSLGVKEITISTIEDYLSQRERQYGIYKAYKGGEYLLKIADTVQVSAFQYYYDRMKKMTLLRMYSEQCGLDLSWLYDVDNILDIKKKQKQEDWLDNTSIQEIADIIDKKISDIKMTYVDNFGQKDAVLVGEGLNDLLQKLEESPEYGYPMYGGIINTVFRGARLKKLYIRSAQTGLGKTRSMVADACYFACMEMFNKNTNKWELCGGTKEPTLFITTEQELSEIQTMCIAFIADVDEDHILTNEYTEEEYERVKKAINILKEAPLYIQEMPDFTLKDIENTVKRNIQAYGVRYVCLDYLHTSLAILSEVSEKSGVKGLREDNILFMIAVKLKDIANEFGVFILTATQLNGNYVSAKEYDQNLLRGSKAIADKADAGLVMLKASEEDKRALEDIIEKGGFEVPDTKISIYKNRRGKYKDILLWSKTEKGTCRIMNAMFATTYQYELVPMTELKIKIKEESAF